MAFQRMIQPTHDDIAMIQRNLRDLALNARINWEAPWAQVPARDKAKLFEVVSILLSQLRTEELTADNTNLPGARSASVLGTI